MVTIGAWKVEVRATEANLTPSTDLDSRSKCSTLDLIGIFTLCRLHIAIVGVWKFGAEATGAGCVSDSSTDFDQCCQMAFTENFEDLQNCYS